jgi:hypothetical protein
MSCIAPDPVCRQSITAITQAQMDAAKLPHLANCTMSSLLVFNAYIFVGKLCKLLGYSWYNALPLRTVEKVSTSSLHPTSVIKMSNLSTSAQQAFDNIIILSSDNNDAPAVTHENCGKAKSELL